MSDQNRFLSTEEVKQLGDEKVIYSAFRTGVDNYRIEFKTVIGRDTFNVFDYYINDALYTKENTFDFVVSSDTLFVLTRAQLCKTHYQTKKGRTITVTKTLETSACEH
jgi:hypothetical protein